LLDAAWALVLTLAGVVSAGVLPQGVTFLWLAAAYAGGRILTDWTREGRPAPPRLSSMQRAWGLVWAASCLGLLLTL
jgi:hypothetical protein